MARRLHHWLLEENESPLGRIEKAMKQPDDNAQSSSTRKLKLNRQTLRELDSEGLERVNGGALGNGVTINTCVTECNTQCQAHH